MTKRLQLIFGVSLVANAALGGYAVYSLVGQNDGDVAVSRRSSSGATDTSGDGSRSTRQTSLYPTGAGAHVSAARVTDDVKELVRLFNTGDAEGLAASLRAAGLSEDLVRAMVREQISSRYRARIRAIQEAINPGERPYWQNPGRPMLSADQRAEIRGLQREMRDELERVLGPDPGAANNRSGRLAFLPRDKAELLAQVESDYGEMSREVRESMEGFRLPSDQDTLRMLNEERRRDIEALLTPEELAQFDARNSPAAARIRNQYGSVIQSEAEYLAIFRLQQAFEQQFGGEDNDLNRRERNVAEGAMRAQILELLGPERAALLARERDQDYRTMQAATRRLNLASDATDRVLAMRASAAEESQRISADESLDAQQKEAALVALAGKVRGQLQQTMGTEGAEAFSSSSNWVRALERGSTFSVRAEGGVAVGRGGGGRGGDGAGRGGRGGGAPFERGGGPP